MKRGLEYVTDAFVFNRYGFDGWHFTTKKRVPVRGQFDCATGRFACVTYEDTDGRTNAITPNRRL